MLSERKSGGRLPFGALLYIAFAAVRSALVLLKVQYTILERQSVFSIDERGLKSTPSCFLVPARNPHFSAGIILVLSACQSFFLEWQTRKEQAYWSNIAAQLSDLCDCLLSLEHREIFSRNEDTIFSKLQSSGNRISKVIESIRFVCFIVLLQMYSRFQKL